MARILILVENLSVPFDRRVWQECRALTEAGHEVSVICPRGSKRDTEPYARIEGVEIHRYALEAATGGPAGYLKEYGTALWQTLRLARRLDRERPFDVIQACNPPDLLFLVALAVQAPGRALRVRSPRSRAGAVPLALRRRADPCCGPPSCSSAPTFRTRRPRHLDERELPARRADARPRGARADDGRAQRARPHAASCPVPPDDTLRRGREHLVVLPRRDGPAGRGRLRAAIAREHCATTSAATTCRPRSSAMATPGTISWRSRTSSGSTIASSSPGRVSDEDVARYLSTADVCLAPDPKNPLNDVSTMNKIVEYMAMSRPLVSFDLIEARVSAGEAARLRDAERRARVRPPDRRAARRP